MLFCAVLALGIFARTWEFRSLPPGLNQDEAAGGVDAFDVYRYGVDRNGNSFPWFFVSYGSGQSAVDIYLLIPFISVGGLSPFTVRLPILLTGILTLPLVYLIGRRLRNARFALISMFLLAIAPWHILLSRWGIESNLLPFFFALGFLMLLKAEDDNRWFTPAMAGLALCLYVYGPAYAAVPLFLAIALPILVLFRRIRPKHLLAGAIVFFLAALPVGIFLLINLRHWNTIHVGPFTIPRLPSRPRFEMVSGLFKGDFVQSLGYQAQTLWNLLWFQTDHNAYNVVDPFGYFYRYTLPLAIIGILPLGLLGKAREKSTTWLLLAWLAATILLGILQRVNINRMNLIFLPLTFCMAACLDWITTRTRVGLALAVGALLIGFILFTRAYHGEAYRNTMKSEFFAGILPAIEYASTQTSGPVCITNHINQPEIYVLFSQGLKPGDYLSTVKFANPSAAYRQPLHLDRYSFGLDNCPNEGRVVYVLLDETPPVRANAYRAMPFELFTVYVPEMGSN